MMENTLNNSVGHNNRSALIWMLTSVIALSFVVFVIDWGETNKSPFLFATFDSFFALFAFLLIVIIRRPILFSKKVLRAVIFPTQDSYRMNLLLAPCILASSAIYPLLSISTRYIDIIPVAVIYGMSPLFFVLISSLLFCQEKRFEQLTIWVFVLFILGFIGFGFVTVGQLEYFSFSFEVTGAVLKGGFLALGAAVLTAISVSFGIRYGTMACQKIKEIGEDIEEIYCIMIARIIQCSVSGIVVLIIAFSLREEFTMRILWAGLIIGFLIVPLGGTAFRQANLLTNNLGINALRYTVPLFSMLWLFLFRDSSYINFAFLTIGTTAIIIANLLLNFETKIRLDYKILILALWFCGTFMYLLFQGIGFYNHFSLT